VVVAFVLYPAIYHLLVNAPLDLLVVQLDLTNEAKTVLPRMRTMTAVLYFGLFAMSFDFISGYTGYLSFGHAAFYGVAAYVVILTTMGKIPLVPTDLPFLFLLLFAALAATALAVVIGALSFRLTGVYFAMITLGFAQLLYVFARNWDYLVKEGANTRAGPVAARTFDVGVPYTDVSLTIGSRLNADTVELLPAGILGSDPLVLGADATPYYLIGIIVLGSYFAMQRIIHSPFGRVMIAIRENEERAAAIGYETFRYKMGAFAMSAFFAGVAGALYAAQEGRAAPRESLYFLVTGNALLGAIIGGFGTLVGPLYGWLFDRTLNEFLLPEGSGGGLLFYLREFFGEATLTETIIFNGVSVNEALQAFVNSHAGFYVGIVFVLFVLYVPGGLLGSVRLRAGGPIAKTWSHSLWDELVTRVRYPLGRNRGGEGDEDVEGAEDGEEGKNGE
jgi:branched-chain amino acid transport system permease protein